MLQLRNSPPQSTEELRALIVYAEERLASTRQELKRVKEVIQLSKEPRVGTFVSWLKRCRQTWSYKFEQAVNDVATPAEQD